MESTKKTLSKNNKELKFKDDIIFASTKNVSLAESRHRRIVEGACKIFFEKGYHPTTTRDIAKACGMSIGQLYHYISCKDDVLYLVHKHMHEVWFDYLKRSDIEKIDDPLKKLTRALHSSLEFMADNKKLIQFVYSESKYLNKDHLKTVLDMDYQNIVSFWRNLLKEVNKTKKIKGDPDFIGSVISYLLAFHALRGWTLNNRQKEKHIDYLVEFILRGLGAL